MSARSIWPCLLISVLAVGAALAACGGGGEDGASEPFYLRAHIVVEDRDNLHPGAGPVESRLELWSVGPGRWRQDIGRWEAEAPDVVIHADGDELVGWNREENTYSRTRFPGPVAPGGYGTSLRIGPAAEDDLDAFLASFRERDSEVPTSAEVVGEDEVLGRAVVVVEVRPAFVSQTFGSGASGPTGDGSVRYWVEPESMFVLRQEIDSSTQGLVADVVELDLDPEFDAGLFDFEPPDGARDVTGLPPEASSGVETVEAPSVFPVSLGPGSTTTTPGVALHVVDAMGPRPLFTPEYAQEADGAPGAAAIQRFAWSPSGDALLAPDDRGLWRVPWTGETEQLAHGHVYDVVWSPGGGRVAIETATAVVVLDLASGAVSEVRPERATLVGWSPDGRWLAVVTPGFELVVWSEHKELALSGSAWGWLPDGRLVYRLGYFDPVSEETEPFTGLRCCESVQLSPDGQYAARRSGADAELLDGRSGAVLARFSDYKPAPVAPLTPEGQLLLVRVEGDPCGEQGQTSTLAVGHPDGSVTVLAQQEWTLMPTWSPDGDRVAFVGYYADLRVVDADGSSAAELWAEGPVELFRWSPTGQAIAYWPARFGRSLCA